MSIQEFRDQVLQEWKEHDPHLEDTEGYREHFNKRFHERQVQEEEEAERKIEGLASEILRPIIVWPGPWAQDNPAWLKGQIKIDRLIQLMRGVEGLATYSEVAFYMLPRAMESPLGHDWTQIYLFTAKQVMGHKVPKSEKWLHDLKLTEWQEKKLLNFRRWLWEKSMKALKERERRRRKGDA